MINVEKIKPTGLFTNYIYKAIPLAFDESMSYYETLCGLLSYLKDTVIPTLNNNADAIIEIQNLMVELQNYVDNYFENLDVQTEINNKLDEMAESGQLTDIIAQYLELAGVLAYNNVNEMKQAQNLVNGSICKTLGYHSLNDGGESYYKVRTITNEDTIDEGSIIALNDVTLVAELIIKDSVNPIQFGAYGDGIHNDLTALNTCHSYCIAHNLTMTSPSNKIYGVNSGFTIHTGCSIDLENATIKALNEMDYVVRQHRTRTVHVDPVLSEFTKNIVIDCDNKANYGFYQDTLGWSVLTENIRVLNPVQIGIYIKTGQIRLHNAKVEQMENVECIGVQVDSSDSEYYNIITRDCKTGFKINGQSNGFYECHPVMFKTLLLASSKAFDLNGWNAFYHPIADTFEYAFYIRHYGGADIFDAQLVINSDYYNDETMSNNPYLLYLVNGDSASSRLNVIGSRLPNSAIINSGYAYFTNVTNWNSGSLILNNPNIAYTPEINGVPREINQINSYTNLISYLNNSYTASTMGATINGNLIEYRFLNITLPAITKDNASKILDELPSKFVPETNKNTNAITKNGVTVVVSTNKNGSISITPISANIQAGDTLYFTHIFIK